MSVPISRATERLALFTEIPMVRAETEAETETGGRAEVPARVAGDATIPALFAAEARRAPDAPAVEDPGTRLTYAQLDARAEALARRLRAAGAGPESRVAVAMERSAELVVALLGILKAGAAYLPLDPAHPPERLAWMLDDAGAAALVVHDAVPSALERFSGPVLAVSADDAPDAEAETETPPLPAPRADSLAYVVYTSGSTGTPKGIAVPHRGVVRLVRETDYAPLDARDRVAQAANASFDAATWEIWGPLLNGGTVVVLPRETTLSPRRLAEALEERGVTALFLTTALFNQVSRELPGAFSRLRHLLFGGEACDPAAVRRVLRAGGPQRLLHVYGPTESTTFATWHHVERVEDGASTVPIGGPVARTSAFVVDDALRPAAPGEEGELLLGGEGLARGYLGRPALTAERFVPDPFSARPGERLYRTGDRVTRDDAGAIRFVGRTDGQVKVRGFRIETAEIEAVLRQHPAISDAAVVARKEPGDETRLVAYLVVAPQPARHAESSGEPEVYAPNTLREWAGARLPEYMLPAAFERLEALPLNANGKVDRKALLDLPSSAGGTAVLEADDASPAAAPRTPTEAAVAAIWREVLGTPVGVDDDFYALGGHSLRAIQVAARVREALGVDLSPVRVLEDARTVAALAAAVDAAAGEARAEGRIPPAPRDRPIPLSFSQEAVWFFQQISPGLRSYNFQATLEMTGALDVPALERALTGIIRRHEVLRTTFPADEDGAPFQRVHAPWEVRLPVIDLAPLPEEARREELKRVLRGEFEQPFDLSVLPLVRWALVRMGEDRHVLVQVEHHFVHDGWSFTVLLRELVALYGAYAAGGEPSLPEPEVQFADYAAWQREWMRSPAAEAQLAFWRRRLEGIPPVLDLPTDRPRPPELTFSGGSMRIPLSPALARAAGAFARAHGATLYSTLLAAFQALLHRYSGQDDFVVGGSVANRARRELEGMLGMVVNTVALRAGLHDDPDFPTLVERVRRTVLEAQAHADVPFERVVEAVHPERTLSHLPIYQVLFSAHQAAMPSLELPGLSIGLTEGHSNGSAKFDLSVVLISRGEQGGAADDVEMIWEFNRDLFREATVRRMVSHFEGLLGAALADPARPVSRHPLVSAGAAEGCVETPADGEPARCLHEIFAEQAARTPDAAAIVHGGRTLSFRELDALANRLAHRLRALGVGPEVPAGVFLDRTPEMVAAMLGILKAGGAYIPLDPDYPSDRLAFMLEESGAPVVVTRRALAGDLPPSPARAVVVEELEGGGEDDAAPPETGVTPDNVAYVIYTSGSTGRPKGVQVAHAGVGPRLRWLREAVPAEDLARVMASTSISFDVSVVEIFGPLAAGGTLVLVENALELASLTEEHGVRAAFMVPSAAAELVRTEGVPPSLRTLLLAGEALPPALARDLYEHTRVERVLNVYGPTEDTVYSTWSSVERGATRVLIGEPLPASRSYVLDPHLRPVPEGVPGELYLAGAGLARGYLRRPGMTAERFLPDVLGREPGARMYRTGDRARIVGGRVEYLGRVDHQVKVRGFRIELGEVESALRSVPGVGECVAVAREDEPGRKRLVAYYVPAADPAPQSPELRARMRERLPEYMVPSAFVAMGALPRTPSGKVDRRALPRPVFGTAADAEGEFVPPRSAAEHTLAGLWKALLGVERISVNDNFFDLGGDSILALQVVSRANRAGVKVTPRQIFQHQTIAGIAAVAGTGPLVAAEQGTVTGDVPLTPVQRWFFAQELAHAHHWNQAVILEAGESVDAAALEAALRALVAHHDALRLRFRREGDAWRQWCAPREDAPFFRRVDLTGAADDAERDRIASAVAAEVQAGLELERGPILGAALLDAGEERPARLLLVIHHLATDGVTWRVLMEDLETAYAQAAAGREPALPRKTTSFRQWAMRLEERAASPELAAELPFWEETAGAVAALPVDTEGAENTEGSVGIVHVNLTKDETRALLRDTTALHRARIDDVLLAALGRVLSGWTRADSVLVDVEGHGREPLFADADVSRTVGWFTSIYPVRLDAGGADAGHAVAAVKERMRRTPDRGTGFGLLRWSSGEGEAAARLAALPQAEVVFNYFGQLDAGSDGRLFRLVAGNPGQVRSPYARRRYLLEVTGRVLGGEMRLTWRYSGAVHRKETVEALSRAYLEALREISGRTGGARAASVTPEDFPLAGMTRADLDALAAALVRADASATLEEVEDVYALTPTQEGMLFHAREAPRSGVYVVQGTWTLHGAMDEDAFVRALEQTVAHHPALRTVFAWEGLSKPLQVVRRRAPLEVTGQDWRGAGEEERQARYAALLREDRRRGFALDAAPPVRFALLRTGEEEHRVVFTFHHLVLDGWSHALVLREVLARYDALRAGRPAALAEAPRYREYVGWLGRQDDAEAEGFWRQTLKGFASPTPLPLDLGHARPLSDHADEPKGDVAAWLDEAATARLAALARRHRVTLSTLVHGAWALVLARYAGEADVVFGTVVAGRPAELDGAQATVGLFAGSLPVRVGIDWEAPLAGWLRELQEKQVEARRWEHTSLLRIREWSALRGGRPLFESLLAFENYPVSFKEDEAEAGLVVGTLSSEDQTNYPLTVVVHPGRRMRIRIYHDRARLDDGAAARVLEHFHALLEGLADDDARRVGDLPSMAESERRAVLEGWNATATPYPREALLHRLYEEQAARTPHAVAVTFGSTSLSYAELNARANRLARRLRALGVGPESCVGMAIERSREMIVAILGILKTGAAYVPLDPTYPADRVSHMLADSRAGVLVVRDALPAVMAGFGGTVVSLERDRAALEALPDADLEGPDPTADTLAYVVYTSGSTGRPKGVAIPHRALVRLVKEADYAEFGPEHVFLQISAVAFDVSALEIWGSLLHGGRLVVAPPTPPTLEELGEMIRAQGVTTLWLTAGLFQRMVDGNLAGLRGVRQLLSGGDVVSAPHCRRVLETYPAIRLIDGYGPTENGTFTTCHTVRRADTEQAAIPVGVPVANTRVYVLDAALRPVPAGAPGELYTGGDGLARGYLHRPAFTAEKWVADPFSGIPGERLYRTGDRVRWRLDGTLEYLGRMDDQVKVRGFRIEPGEVEATLLRHPSVRTAAVAAKEDATGDKILAAYVVPADGGEVDAGALRAFLREHLPAPMVPSAFVRMDSLPLSPNGKVDRRSLPVPDASAVEGAAGFVAPRTPVEEALVEIFAEVLGVSRVGVEDDFFAMGGHSLRAMQVASRVRERLGQDLPLRALFDAPTVGELALLLDQTQDTMLADLLAQLDGLSDEEARMLLELEGAD